MREDTHHGITKQREDLYFRIQSPEQLILKDEISPKKIRGQKANF